MECSFLDITRSGSCSSDAIMPVFFVLDRKGRHDCAEEITIESRVVSPSVCIGVSENEAVDRRDRFVVEREMRRSGKL
jgi:hypothetical protein